ncbi:hypothetical protein Asp14428_29350 [Actinoplanes sp. NBRC 14428]|uniref:Methionine-rich copper-binding protein CopC n=1 Tax=Pseudosporangium ferrugineum TaxID=439699 RepID=A0A2T0RS02_9ACTN|nr:hypothetical protein [Pseudosporangium ferrugineum]PRY23897.1 hypothetical protein CLV70_11427 [Pseudosporangium ferrugineum]BCJ51460.1 hypothetical protein Asp14428_29350 [Actinoplanes sp. NBRC 14428]
MISVRRKLAAVAAAVLVVLLPAAPAAAYEPVNIVHTEQVQAGPYAVTVGFSEWPLRAMQSLDFTFIPAGGIAGKSGRLLLDGPGIDADHADRVLARHPRKLDVWGLDVVSLAKAGGYTIGFRIDGPQGPAEGRTQPLPVLAQPGPPLALSWAICAIPIAGLIVFLVVAWRRARPSANLVPLAD